MTRELAHRDGGLSTDELTLIEHEVINEAPTVGMGYLLWLFLGLFSAHRFYMGKPGSAVLQIMSYFVLIGFAWWIVDGFRMERLVDERKDLIRGRMIKQLTHRSVRRDSPPRPSRAPGDARFDRYRAT
jgi:TM2 domain-containing membrane protein YozV